MIVFLWLRKLRPRFAQGQLKGYFQRKELDRTTEAIVPMNVELRWRRLSVLSSTRQHVAIFSLAAVQKESLFVPMAQAPPKAGAKELLYSLNLIHEFRSLFSPKVIFAGLLRKAFPQKHAFVDMSVFLWLRKQRPRFAQSQPKGYFQMKELDRTFEAIVPICPNE